MDTSHSMDSNSFQSFEHKRHLSFSSDLSGLRLETDRDYGLLHSLRPVTPHPGHHEPISLNALRQRLMDAQEESERREDSQIFISKKKTPATNSQRRKGHYSFSETSEAAEAPEQPANCSQPGFTQHVRVGKKVVIICPRVDVLRSRASVNSQGPSFKERRRLFNMAEFTIAKNGKKMCDSLMTNVVSVTAIDSEHLIFKRCNDEIEKYIQDSGLTRTPRHTLNDEKDYPEVTEFTISPTENSQVIVPKKDATKRRSILLAPSYQRPDNSPPFRNISFSN